MMCGVSDCPQTVRRYGAFTLLLHLRDQPVEVKLCGDHIVLLQHAKRYGMPVEFQITATRFVVG